MKLLSSIRYLVAKTLHRSQQSAEMDEELRSHIEHRADDLERSGLDRAAAEHRARVEFGGRARFSEECREALGGNFLETFWQDARFSLRLLRKSPGFTLAAVLTLALAIGANAVVFGVLDALILRPLNVPGAQSLYGTEYGSNPGWQSYPNYRDLRDRNHSFEDLAAFSFAFVGLNTGNNPTAATGFSTTGNYFDVLQVRPYLGRVFHGSDEHGANSAPYVVLSYAYWHSHFLDDRTVLGRKIQINAHPFTVIGVGPREFRGTLLFVSPDFFMPMVNQDALGGGNALNERTATDTIFEAFGHLKPGVTPAQALADVDAVGSSLEKMYPREFAHKRSTLSREGLTAFGEPARQFLTALMLLAGLILLAACANLGSLFAARAADRAREVALRLALGSSRSRILRGLLTEAALISLGGGALGLLGSVILLHQISNWQPFSGAPIHLPVEPNTTVYLIALVLALVSGFLFGIVPVRQVLRSNPYDIVKSGSRTTGERRITVRDGLLVVQIAICAVLVTSSLVAVRGLMRSLHGNFGFEPRNTMLAGVNLTMAGYHGSAVPDMQKRMITALETIPGVDSVGLVNGYPPLAYGAGTRVNVFRPDVSDLRPVKASMRPYQYEISPGYFRSAGTPMLAGRSFSWHDDKSAPSVAIVNREFASRMFGSVSSAIGGHYKFQDGARVEIVGVADDGKYLSLAEDQQPAMFLSFLQRPSNAAYLIARSSREPDQVAEAMRSKLRDLDGGLPLDLQTWNSLLEVVQFPSRMATMALGVLGLMGAVLSITGIFGMAAYSVSKRLKELGIRLALGAQRNQVLQTALGRALRLLALGSTAGVILGLLASRLLASIVYQATPRDPVVLIGVVLAMLLLGLVATWIPAQRVLSLNAITLLREE